MNKNLQNMLIAIALILTQVLLLNNLQLRGILDSFVAPCIYILYIIIILPMGASQVHLLLSSFALGLAVDFFSGTLGVNAAACVLIGFIRPSVMRLLVTREDRDKNVRPSVYTLGLSRFLMYTLILALTFHLALFFLEVFTFYEFYFTILRAILSSIVAVAIILVFEIFFEKRSKGWQ